MISTNEFKTGLTIELDGKLYKIINYDHVKPGKGGAFLQTKLKNIENGKVTNKRFRAGEKVSKAHIDNREYQYLYREGNKYIFMDQESYEQISIPKEDIGEAAKFIKENSTIEIQMYQGEAIGIDLPVFVELAVTKSPPAVRGDTVSGGTKEVTLETGAKVEVPLFIDEGDILKIDTRSGEYMERLN